MEIDLKQIRELMRAVKQADFTEIELEKDGERIVLRRGGAGAPAPLAPSMPPPDATLPPAVGAHGGAPSPTVADPSIVYVTSPFVGTFYRAASPDAAPFVNVGSVVEPRQVLCIVEAMKLMNEIEAEVAGTVLEVLVENGKSVEFGDRLFKIKKA